MKWNGFWIVDKLTAKTDKNNNLVSCSLTKTILLYPGLRFTVKVQTGAEFINGG